MSQLAAASSTSAIPTEAPSPVSFAVAFRFWLKLGFISFGGPAGQIAVMHQELVERQRWISERRFLHALNYCMLLPGPEAQQLATYIGWLMHRTWGGIVAGGLFVLPSLFILIALTWVYLAFGNVPVVAGIFYGIKPAVTAIVVFAAYRIGSRALNNAVLWAIAAAAFIGIFAFHIPFPAIVLAAGLIGVVGGRLASDKFKTGGGHGSDAKGYGPAIIDDNTPTPSHALFSWNRLLALTAIGLGIWALAMGALTLAYGWQATITQIGWFFTKAALLTFGGAYAVLPYVYQGGSDDRRTCVGRNHAGPAHHDRSVRGFCGSLDKRDIWPGCIVHGGCSRGNGGYFFYLFALIFVYSDWWTTGGIHTR